jgi:acyl-CoA thioesterase-1
MADTPLPRISRRTLVAAGLASVAVPALAAQGQVVTLLGDSITAGYGLPAQAALPNQLHLALQTLGVQSIVRAAGVSGDTSAGGAARVDFSVQPGTALCVVELGGNDLLQGLDPKATRANLARILTRLKARRISVVLAGIAAPPELGRSYANEFNAVYTSLARQYGVTLYPDLLAGVARNSALIQPDGIHPNARGAAIIARRLAPVVAQALRGRR